MLTEKQKEELSYFLESVNQVTHPIAPESSRMLYDLGLIIFEDGSGAAVNDILSVFPKDKIEVLEYSNNKYENSFIEKMANLIENKKWALIDLEDDPGHNLINQLKHLSDSNIMQLLDFRGKEIYNLKLLAESRVIVAVRRDFIEKEISYPHFLNIFGPIISL